MPRPLEDATGLMIHGPLSLAKQSDMEKKTFEQHSNHREPVKGGLLLQKKRGGSYCRIPGTRREAQKSAERCGSS